MPLGNSQIISRLDRLIQACRDAEQGFRMAANGVEDQHLRILFNNYSQQRVQLAAELQKEVRRLGGTPEMVCSETGGSATGGSDTGSSAMGAVHRGWTRIKSAIGHHDDPAVLAECEHGEDAMIEEYEDTLASDFPPNVRQIINRQYAAVRAARDRIRELEQSHAS